MGANDHSTFCDNAATTAAADCTAASAFAVGTGGLCRAIKQVPGSLGESISALEQDSAFLLEGDVFTPDVLETWISMKRTKDIAPVSLRPHPYEFFLYYDA